MSATIVETASSLMANERTAWIGHALIALAFLVAFAATRMFDVRS